MSEQTYPTWVSVIGSNAVCGRCPMSAQADLSTDTLLAHLEDPELAHRHGDWANPTPAQTQARDLVSAVDWPDADGPRPSEVIVDAITPLIEELNRLRAQQDNTDDDTERVSYPRIAPSLAEAGFATYLPRQVGAVNAVLLTEDNLDQVAQAIGGTILEGRTRRLRFPTVHYSDLTTHVAEIGEVLVQIEESQLDPWRRNVNQPRFYTRSADGFHQRHFLPGQPQHQDPEPNPAPAEHAARIRIYADTIDRSHPARAEAGYKLDLALDIYDRLAKGDTEVLRDEQVDAARHLRSRARDVLSTLPKDLEIAMDCVASWMISRPSSTRTPVTAKGTRYVDRHGNAYTDMGDGTLRTGGPLRMLDYRPVEPYTEVLFRVGPLTHVPLDDD
ncbi:hypothetical protein [Nocardiopsis synnemataformans]|uniref:hypothetical protein n=1 Tax=Nocardiopsis synnemataformans TaxID=61305 RepID=UPI003EB96878